MKLLCLSLAFILVGCASMFQAGPDPVSLSSTPPGAQVLLDGVSIGATPLQVSVHRRSSGSITIQSPGYYPVSFRLATSVNGTTFLNLLSPWLVGFVIDAAAGNCSRWESPGTISLSPMPGGQAPAQPPSAGSASHPEIVGSGTGFFITQDGFLVTNEHVVNGGVRFQVITSDGTKDASLVHSDPGNDLAVLKIDGAFSVLPLAASDAMLGATVATVGFPNPDLQGYSPKLAKGEVASLAGVHDDPREYQVSVPLQPGNSGGALVDERGNVVGVVSARINQRAAVATSGTVAESVNYAIKSGVLIQFLDKVPGLPRPLPAPREAKQVFEDVVLAAQKATALVRVFK